MNRRLIFLLPLVLLTLACVTLTSLFLPSATLILKPADPAKADILSLEETRQIIQERLKHADIKSKVSLQDGGKISVEIYRSEDLDTAQKLSTEIGAIVFVDSIKSYPEGYKLGTMSVTILTQSDIQSTLVQKITISGVEIGTYEIAVQFTAEGTKKMADYSNNNVGHFLLIVKDGVILISPEVLAPITDGSVVIQGDFDLTTANLIAAQLRTRSLPFELDVDQIKQRDTK